MDDKKAEGADEMADRHALEEKRLVDDHLTAVGEIRERCADPAMLRQYLSEAHQVFAANAAQTCTRHYGEKSAFVADMSEEQADA